MAGITYVTGQPEVVKLGGAVEERYAYTADASEAVAAGDLIRIASGGTVKLAEDNTDSIAGALTGMALEDTVAGSGLAAPVLLFAEDTVVSMPVCDATNWDADYSAGLQYELDPASVTGTWAIGLEVTAPLFTAIEVPSTGAPWTDVYGSFIPADDTDNVGGRVYCTVLPTVLNGLAGA